MQQWYQCPSCGATVAFGTRFCGNCGTQLNWPTQQTQPPPAYQQQIQQSRSYEQRRGGITFGALGIVFAVLSLGLFPIIFGAVALVFGVIGIVRDSTVLGAVSIVLGVLFAFIGALWGVAVWSHLLA